MSEALGLDQRNQRRRIQTHAILGEGYRRGVIYAPPGTRGGGGQQAAGLLRVDLVPLWLSGIRLNRVKKEMRAKIKDFQRNAAATLWEAFQDGRLTADPDFESLLQQDTDAVQAYKIAQAVVRLARNQIITEARLDSHEQRLEAIEAQLAAPAHAVSQDQASQISQAVKAVAIALGKQTKRNEFGAVYGEMYRKFGITSYKLLPAARFDEAMAWLTEWHQQIAGDEPF